MKCYFVIREDLDYTSDRLFKLAVKETAKINSKEWSQEPRLEVLMMYNLKFVFKLEERLIEDGIFFEWIEENNTLIGIRISPTNDYTIIKTYLDDCLTLKDFAKFRQDQFNELYLERN